jgi:hypothetical protein
LHAEFHSEVADSLHEEKQSSDYYWVSAFKWESAQELTMRNGIPKLCSIVTLIVGCAVAQCGLADEGVDVQAAERQDRIDTALRHALEWLSRQQDKSGGFPTDPSGQPGVTSLCVLAFMSQGHLPGNGRYGAGLDRGIRYVLDSQKDSGLIAREAPNGPQVPHEISHNIGRTSAYNHAISALMLSEAYGMVDEADSRLIRPALEKALKVTLAEQRRKKPRDADRGGWRYLHSYDGVDSDLSVVGWNLTFLRSARNAGFDVPEKPINDAVEYVSRCFVPATGQFQYTIGGTSLSRGMAGAGILSLAHAGKHKTPEARKAAEWLLTQPFDKYNLNESPLEIYHYSVFYCCQAMYQMGDEYWDKFFPATADTLLENQNADGSWDTEQHPNDVRWGNSFTTAMVVLGLSAPNEQLPIFQR